MVLQKFIKENQTFAFYYFILLFYWPHYWTHIVIYNISKYIANPVGEQHIW